MTRVELPPKLAGAIQNYTFDFAALLGASETISTKAVTATVYSGTDATPAAIVSGAATSAGSIVTQKITGGVLGVMYELLCQITTSAGQTLQLVGLLAIIPDEV